MQAQPSPYNHSLLSLLPGGRIGVYDVVAKLGEGGMGEVYRARDTKLDRDVALKILPESFASDPDRLMRFEREAKTLASLNHPHIAQIYGLEENALVMELVDGEDLSQRIARGPIPLDEVLPIAKQIADALEAAHDAGIIHRDLKPANVKVRLDGTVKVLDFGLAKASEQGSGIRDQGSGHLANSPTITSPAMTMHGVILGTAAYMAPEQARGKAVDKRADIWAFGVVLHEMLTGRKLFDGDELSDVLAAVLRQNVDLTSLPADTPASVRRVLRRCLEKDRDRRLADIGDARLEIVDALAGTADAAAPTADRGSVDQNRWRRFAAALAMLSLALMSWLAWQASRPAAGVVPDSRLLSFALLDDPALQIFLTTQPLATSPDGQHVVFGASAGASSGLWVRSLDRATPRMLEGTLGGIQPAVSPDGQWVAFVVANHIIRKVRLSGGAPTTIASIDDVIAAIAWESDSSILFEKIGSRAGIHRVNANGGQPEPLIPIVEGERIHRAPFVARESRLVFFCAIGDDGSETLAVFSLADDRRERLGIDGFRALGLIDGYLVYARSDGSLMAVPFDARELRTQGEPRQLEPRVAGSYFGPSVTLAENGTLVALPPATSLSRLLTLGGAQSNSVGEARAFASPRFSPDGRRIAFGVTGGDAVGLWILDRASGAATRLLRGNRVMNLESWMPDGRSLMYRSDNALWAMPVDDSREPRKLFEDGLVLGASVLPGGQWAAVWRRLRTGEGGRDREELARVPLAGNQPAVTIFSSRSSGMVFRGLDPRASPDGKFVAIHDRNDNQVHVRAVDGSGGLQVSDTGGSLPVWGHDSRSVYYQTPTGTIMAELQTTPSLAVLRRHVVPGIPAGGVLHDVSHDGKTLLILEPVDRAPKVQVTVNWAADVRRQLRAGGSQP